MVFYAPSAGGTVNAAAELSLVVEAVGRSNGGCDWDFKGLQSGNVTLNGASIVGLMTSIPAASEGVVWSLYYKIIIGAYTDLILFKSRGCGTTVNARSLS